jgi:hypothetical protein
MKLSSYDVDRIKNAILKSAENSQNPPLVIATWLIEAIGFINYFQDQIEEPPKES